MGEAPADPVASSAVAREKRDKTPAVTFTVDRAKEVTVKTLWVTEETTIQKEILKLPREHNNKSTRHKGRNAFFPHLLTSQQYF